MRLCFLACAALAALPTPPAAAQQIDVGLLDTTLPVLYNRGRTISVTERRRPEYDPVGIRFSGFTALPSVQTGIGSTSNVFLTEERSRGDGYFTLLPRLLVNSNWSVHSLRLDTGGSLSRYFSNSGRNENGWHLQGIGTYDFTPDLSLSLTGRTARQYETPFTSVSVLNAREPTPYQTSTVRAMARGVFVRSRILAAVTYNKLDYKSVDLLSGMRLDQNLRDRRGLTGTAHYEYGLTPSVAFYAEGAYTRVKYDQPLARLVENRDSGQWRILGGVNFDLRSLVRGSVAVGYTRRKFDSARYRTASGVSAAVQLEYFPTELTTVTLGARREVEDANFVDSSAFFLNAASLSVDHELLYNMLLNANVQYEIDDYVGLPGTARIFRTGVGARYAISNRAVLLGNFRYSKRNSDVPVIAADISERRATISLLLQQ